MSINKKKEEWRRQEEIEWIPTESIGLSKAKYPYLSCIIVEIQFYIFHRIILSVFPYSYNSKGVLLRLSSWLLFFTLRCSYFYSATHFYKILPNSLKFSQFLLWLILQLGSLSLYSSTLLKWMVEIKLILG